MADEINVPAPAPARVGPMRPAPEDRPGLSDTSAEERLMRAMNVPDREIRPNANLREEPSDDGGDDYQAPGRDADWEPPTARENRAKPDTLDAANEQAEDVSQTADDFLTTLDPDAMTTAAGELDEIEFQATNGKKYVVPKEIVDGALRQSDYTRKAAEVAETARLYHEQKRALDLEQSIFNDLAPGVARLNLLRDQQQRLRANMPDPSLNQAGYQEANNQLATLIGATQQLEQALSQRRTELVAEKQSSIGELRNAADRYLTAKLPKWNSTVYSAVSNHLAAEGFSAAEVQNLLDPRVYKLAHDAALYQQIAERRQTVKGKLQTAAPVVRPQGRPTAPNTERQRAKNAVVQARRSGNTQDAENALTALLKANRKR